MKVTYDTYRNCMVGTCDQKTLLITNPGDSLTWNTACKQTISLPAPKPLCVVYRIAGNIRGVQILFFSFSVYQNENLTHETYVMMGVFSCVKWTE